MTQELSSLKSQIQSQNDQVKLTSEEIVREKKSRESFMKEKSRLQAQVDRARSEFESISHQYEDARFKRNKLDEKRK